MNERPSHRLPTTVRPVRYDLRLEPDLRASTFRGRASIDLEVTETVDELVLHSVGLQIDRAVLRRDDREETLTVLDRSQTEMIALRPGQPIPAGSCTLVLGWRGRLTDDLVGFYRSTYVDDRGVERRIACTQFESTHARRAFPCWDEPAFKAVFDIGLVVDEDHTAISNGAEISSTSRGDGRRSVRFSPTIPLSTYLVAFVVGPFEVGAPIDVDGVPLRAVTPIGRLHLADHALEVGVFALRFLTEWYGIPYPGDKIDLVALPDFSFGAMENQGCITFRETALLLDSDRSTRDEQMRVADVVAHELAHMWFGNLVTMAWWEGIWLNEAFATFMEIMTTDAFRPDWNRWVEFGLARSAAFDTDSLTTTRPIEYGVETADDAEAMFDVLTYEKGSSLVRMLQQHLGADVFREGLRSYLATHAGGNTVTADLWDALERTAGRPVREMMDRWIHRGGHPIVTVERDGDRALVLRQRRCVHRSDPAAGVDPPVESDRIIPVGLRIGHGGDRSVHRIVLDRPESRFEFDHPIDWFVANDGGDGFYRVESGDRDLDDSIAIAATELGALERFGLVEDEWALLLAGGGGVTRILRLVAGLAETERDLAVWRRMLGVLSDLGRIGGAAGRDRLRRRFATHVRRILEPAHLDVSARADHGSPEPVLAAALRVGLALTGEDPDLRGDARRDFDRLGADPRALGAEAADAVVRIVAVDADEAIWNEIRARALRAETAQDRLRHHGALADARDPQLVRRLVDLVFEEEIRTQDGPFLLRRALANPDAAAAVWSMIEARWSEILGRFPTASIPRMLEGIATVVDRRLAERIGAFLDDHAVPGAALPIAQHRERMWTSIALVDRLGGELDEALG